MITGVTHVNSVEAQEDFAAVFTAHLRKPSHVTERKTVKFCLVKKKVVQVVAVFILRRSFTARFVSVNVNYFP